MAGKGNPVADGEVVAVADYNEAFGQLDGRVLDLCLRHEVTPYRGYANKHEIVLKEDHQRDHRISSDRDQQGL